MGTAFAVKGATSQVCWRRTRWRAGATSRPTPRPADGDLVRRLRRLRGHRLQPGQGQDAADLARRTCSTPSLQEPWSALNGNPTHGGRGVRRRLRGGAVQRRLVQQHRPGRRLLHEAEGRRATSSRSRPAAGRPRCRAAQTPIIVWWDYLLASEVRPGRSTGFKIVIPSRTATTPSYYDQAINKPRPRTRPPPGCGRSTCTPPPARTCGCRARPGRSSCPRWSADGTVNKAAYAALPPAPSGHADVPEHQLSRTRRRTIVTAAAGRRKSAADGG